MSPSPSHPKPLSCQLHLLLKSFPLKTQPLQYSYAYIPVQMKFDNSLSLKGVAQGVFTANFMPFKVSSDQ